MIERQLGRQNSVLYIEKAVVARREIARLGHPDFGAWIGRVDSDVHNFRHAHGPVANRVEVALVPARIGDDVDGSVNVQ